MKPTNKSLLSLPARHVSQTPLAASSPNVADGNLFASESAAVGHVEPSAAPATGPTMAAVSITPPIEPVEPGARQSEVRPAQQAADQPLQPPVPAARAGTQLVGALICTSLALVASIAFIAHSHLAVTPLATSGLQPLPEIGVADIAQIEPGYAMELAFPPRETAIPQPVVARRERPAKLKIGVYKQVNNVEKWRRWARQQNVTFEAVQKNRDGEPHYFLYLCEQDPARVDQLKRDVARISGETPQLVRRATSTRI